MALLFARVIIIITRQFEAAEHPLRQETFPPLARLARLGLVGGVHAIHRLLQEQAYQFIGGFENGRAHQQLQLGDRIALHRLGVELRDYLLDFLFLGQEDPERGRLFFFEPAARSSRVCAITV